MTDIAPATAVQKAVFVALAGDPGLATLLGGPRIYDEPPRNQPTPYVHLGEAVARDWSTATESGAEIRFLVIVVSGEAGRSQALAVAERAGTILHDAALVLEGHRLVNLRRLATETKRSNDLKLRRAELRFRAVTEPLAG